MADIFSVAQYTISSYWVLIAFVVGILFFIFLIGRMMNIFGKNIEDPLPTEEELFTDEI